MKDKKSRQNSAIIEQKVEYYRIIQNISQKDFGTKRKICVEKILYVGLGPFVCQYIVNVGIFEIIKLGHNVTWQGKKKGVEKSNTFQLSQGIFLLLKRIPPKIHNKKCPTCNSISINCKKSA